MGNVVCILTSMYCRAGCKSSVIASALTFHPPEPYYLYKEMISSDGEEDAKECEAEYHSNEEVQTGAVRKNEDHVKRCPIFHEDLGGLPDRFSDKFVSYLLTSSNKTKVPVILFHTPKAYFTMIISHGNASDMGSMWQFYYLCATAFKVNVVGYDYTGYGESMRYNVNPSEEQTYNDIETVYDWVCNYKKGMLIPSGDPSKHIIMYGQSVGSGPSTFIASNQSTKIFPPEEISSKSFSDAYAEIETEKSYICSQTLTRFKRRRIAALILHSPIMSGLRVLTENRCLAGCDIYPNINRITTVTSPVLIIHGEKDVEVKIGHGKRLYAAVPKMYRSKPWWVKDRGHNDVLLDNEDEFSMRVREFLFQVKGAQKTKNSEGDLNEKKKDVDIDMVTIV